MSSVGGFCVPSKMNISLLVLALALFLPRSVHNQDRRPAATSLQGQPNAVLSTNKCSSVLPHKRIVCFYRIEDDFRPFDLDPCLCTHIVYSYVAVKENFAFIAGKKGDLKYLSALRSRNPSVKIIVSLRPTGTQFTLEDPKNITYPLPPSNTLRHRFAKRIRDFLNRHGLDGIDLDYEYFKQEQHSNNSKRDYLISIIQSISSSLKQGSEGAKLLLSLTTSRYPRHLADYYDFSELNKYVDFVNIPAFNFDQDGNQLIHPSKLHGISEMENMDAIMDLAFALGLPSHQLVVGVPTFGTLYRLANASQTTPGSASISWSANKQPITTISHSKICDVREKANWTLVREKDLTAPYIHLHDKWIGFDDEISVKLKAKYVVLRQAGGLAFFHLNEDDPTGQCGLGAYPLVQSAYSVLTKPIEQINLSPSPSPLFTNFTQNFFMSFLDLVVKHGNVERVIEDDEDSSSQTLPCSHNGYLRHPEDCTRFYRCLKFDRNDRETQKFQYTCPAGLVFDENYQICNWPSWSPSCIGSGEISTSSKQSFVCSKAGFFQDPDNCENFYYCSDLGKSYLQSYEFKCPFELGFDGEKLQCNWKWLVNGCEYVPPEERIVKDLQQILPQAISPPLADDQEEITPAASEVSELFEHVGDDLTEPASSGEDEFEERSDGESPQHPLMRGMAGKFNPLHLWRLSKGNNAEGDSKPGSRLQMLSSYVSKWYSRMRNVFWPASTLESRSDRLNTGNWLNPFNHLSFPKFKPFRKSKTENVKKPKQATKIKRVKKGPFEKNPFKIGKLPKFGKDKKKNDATLTSANKGATKANGPKVEAPFAMMPDLMPMFVEETAHVPQFVKPPSNFAFNHFSMPNIAKQPMQGMMTAESSMQPVAVRANTRNHFNNNGNQAANNQANNMHLNVLNDYQVASSFAINTFGDHQHQQQHQSNAGRETFGFGSTKAPAIGSQSHFHSSIKPAINPKKPLIVSAATNERQQRIVPKPALSNALGDPFRPYRHSYGLPSVNIRYAITDKLPPPPSPAPKPKPITNLQSVRIVAQPKPINNAVKIETTKFNFPSGEVVENDDNSADAQLEHFLRDKFIHNPQHKASAKPGSQQTGSQQIQPNQAFRQSRTQKPIIITTSKPRAAPKPTTPKPAIVIHRPLPGPSTVNKPKNVASVTNNKLTNQFSTFTSAVDPFANEREKFFAHFNARPTASPTAVHQPAKFPAVPKPVINYKLTPITETVFEINNQSAHRVTKQQQPAITHVPETPVIPARDPVSNAVHKANRFEYIRSTHRPSVVYESYEWTTPTSLRNDKVKVDFNVMTGKDITEEINSKKYLFSDHPSYKPIDAPLNKPSFFPPIGDVFRNYHPSPVLKQRGQPSEQPALDSFLAKSTTEATVDTIEESEEPTTPPPTWLSTPLAESGHPTKPNDTNEYIMLMLNNQGNAPGDPTYHLHLRDLFENSKNLAKVYNVQSNGASTLLALLPKFAPDGSIDSNTKPFVYKGEHALLKNMSDSDVLKLDISNKPDSELLHSIFDKVKDQLSGAEKLLPTEEDIGLINSQAHNARRINPSSANVVYDPANYERHTVTSTTTARPSTSNVFNYQVGSTGQPWYEHFEEPNQPANPPIDTVYEFHGENQANQKLNRSSNAWYDDVSKTQLVRPSSVEYDGGEVPISSESPSSRSPPASSTRRYTRPSTTTTTTPAPTQSSTTTTTTTEATTAASSKAPKITRRPQLRRKPEYGSRAQSSPSKLQPTDGETIRETKPQPAPTQNIKPETPTDYSNNQNNFGQKLNGRQPTQPKDSYAEVSSTEKPMFYEEELPEFTDLHYPETQNNHHPSSSTRRTAAPSATTSSPETVERKAPAKENTYYPDSTIHNLKADKTGIPESACSRPGIFQHPNDCNKYYECYWDKHINKFTLQPFECPVKLAFDSRIIGCGSPNDPTVCVQY